MKEIRQFLTLEYLLIFKQKFSSYMVYNTEISGNIRYFIKLPSFIYINSYLAIVLPNFSRTRHSNQLPSHLISSLLFLSKFTLELFSSGETRKPTVSRKYVEGFNERKRALSSRVSVAWHFLIKFVFLPRLSLEYPRTTFNPCLFFFFPLLWNTNQFSFAYDGLKRCFLYIFLVFGNWISSDLNIFLELLNEINFLSNIRSTKTTEKLYFHDEDIV